MTTINRLSPTTPTSADKIPVWSEGAGDSRSVTVASLREFIVADLEIPTGGTGGEILPNSITNDKLAIAPAATLKGRVAGSAGDIQDLAPSTVRAILNVADGATANASDAELRSRATHTGTQPVSSIAGATPAGAAMLQAINESAQTALLSTFNTSLKGLVPAPGSVVGGRYLREDGQWTVPPGSGGGGGGGAGVTTQVTLSSGTAQVVDLAPYVLPCTAWVSPAAGCTVLIEELVSGTWTSVQSVTSFTDLTIYVTPGTLAPTSIRFTRTAGTATTSTAGVQGFAA